MANVELDDFFSLHSSHPQPQSIAVNDICEKLGHRAVVIQNLLSAEECETIIRFLDEEEQKEDVMVAASTNLKSRNCQRLVGFSRKIADILYSRLQPQLASIEEHVIHCTPENGEQFLANGFGMHGEWRLDGLNDMFRLCKYYPGGHFAPHADGEYVRDITSHRSLKTFMIYLNDNYEGGTTNFCEEHNLFHDDALNVYRAPDDKVLVKYKARRGDCLVFDHKLLHEGDRVISGQKYIMRSDIMYRKHRVNGEMSEDEKKQEEALKIWQEGADLEAGGDVDAAVKKYSRAMKVYPGIDRMF